MVMLGAALFGTLFFLVALFAVILLGAAGNKWEKDIRAVTERERANGLLGDVTLKDPDIARGPHIHAHA
ncbi:hypothetical protein HUA74_30435 [Myxococcus sp. CA051A]|uniref:Uncharacterized protein n=1 Tax=Myxococcus llanfairpwllgwyngyllgogerychwyrndrobwllllantysiliogogogochensis TaxID=2590453 RepID=A0A540X233_9BACT|nr:MULTISPECIES: hypothetical protein [Myxococcus]NTX06388.1 hypothetical protein [Myxococcus sp. CA040A]NTX35007.1 hypothetical protein [Myxococcus sp. CA033]NTX64981.1 hypothetical protein [Myxococcus sp. CA051A]TQF15325.1 hypothetical protein FJV41_14250 [Myxococcus llanfairpwllgwyngyllgogerychwyrndrobwllllantysiliogogogochensis]